MTALRFNYLHIYTCGVATANQTSTGSPFLGIVNGIKPSILFTKTLRLGYCFVLATQLYTF